VYIVSIDGSPIADSELTATKPIRLTAGFHSIEVAQRAGGFFAKVAFQFNAKAQTTYRARAQQEQDVPWYRQQLYSAGGPTFFWIEDYSTGLSVSEKQKIMVTVPDRGLYIPVIPVKK
jgi:hypothetical protein